MLDKLSDFLSAIIAHESVKRQPEDTLQLAIAVLLIEVMQSDAESTFEEQAAILSILKQRFRMSDAEVEKLTAHAQQAARKANDFYRFTTLINHELALPEKVRIIEYMWQVAYADGKISAHENHLMHKIVDLLHIPLGDNVAAKALVKPVDTE